MGRGPLSFRIYSHSAAERDMRKTLDNLRASHQRAVIRPAMRAAMSPLRKQVKANVPQMTGTLKKSIGIIMRTYRGGHLWGAVGARKGFARVVQRNTLTDVNPNAQPYQMYVDPAKYLHLVENGSKGPPWRKSGRSKPGRHVRNAFMASVPRMKQVFAQRLRSNYSKLVRRYAKKGRTLPTVRP